MATGSCSDVTRSSARRAGARVLMPACRFTLLCRRGSVAYIMQPTITRETILIDRRQPMLRWSAVFAGAACSIGFWMLLQLIGVGVGLAAVDVNNAGSLRS